MPISGSPLRLVGLLAVLDGLGIVLALVGELHQQLDAARACRFRACRASCSAASSSRSASGYCLRFALAMPLQLVDPELVVLGLFDRDRVDFLGLGEHARPSPWPRVPFARRPSASRASWSVLRSPQASVRRGPSEAIAHEQPTSGATPPPDSTDYALPMLLTKEPRFLGRGSVRCNPTVKASTKLDVRARRKVSQGFQDVWTSPGTPRCSRSPSSSCDCAGPPP